MLTVWKLDRLGRSLPHLVGVLESLKGQGVGFRSLTLLRSTFFSQLLPEGRGEIMFRWMPASDRAILVVTFAAIGLAAGCLVALLRATNPSPIQVPAAVSVLVALFAWLQWLINQSREAARVSWDAIQTYYQESDSPALAEARRKIHEGDMSDAAMFCNFFEKWGRLVEFSYLPLELFNGPSGDSISNALLKLEPLIEERRRDNPRYARSYVALVQRILDKGYLKDHPAERQIANVLRKFKVG